MIASEVLKFKKISDDYDRAYQLVSYLFRDKKIRLEYLILII